MKAGLLEQLEALTLGTCPAQEELDYRGWLLRYSHTSANKRAKSITAQHHDGGDLIAKIAVCERRYADQGLPAMFRVTPFSQPADLDSVLARRGYTLLEPSLVLYRELDQEVPAVPAGFRELPLGAWLDTLHRLRGFDAEQGSTHRLRLQMTRGTIVAAAIFEAAQAVAAGLGVLEERCLGMFDIITAPEARNRGYGKCIVGGLLASAKALRAEYSYLQVSESNTPAVILYRGLGFIDAYRYWYRVAPA